MFLQKFQIPFIEILSGTVLNQKIIFRTVDIEYLYKDLKYISAC